MSTQASSIQNPAATQSLGELIQHILDTHHAYLRSELPFLEERIAKMCANHGQDRPELFAIQQTLQDLRDDLMNHLQKEEQVLFPYIQGLEETRRTGGPAPEACFPSVRFPIRMMLIEHDGAQDLLGNLRRSSSNYTAPDFVCDNGRQFYTRLEGLETDLLEHIRVENEILFPRAVELEELGQ
jgi:regulator of cell morphogenesis and NO signaling